MVYSAAIDQHMMWLAVLDSGDSVFPPYTFPLPRVKQSKGVNCTMATCVRQCIIYYWHCWIPQIDSNKVPAAKEGSRERSSDVQEKNVQQHECQFRRWKAGLQWHPTRNRRDSTRGAETVVLRNITEKERLCEHSRIGKLSRAIPWAPPLNTYVAVPPYIDTFNFVCSANQDITAIRRYNSSSLTKWFRLEVASNAGHKNQLAYCHAQPWWSSSIILLQHALQPSNDAWSIDPPWSWVGTKLVD